NLVAVASALAKEPVRRRAEPAPSPPPSRTVPAMTVVDNAVYVDGRRYAEPDSLDVPYELLRERGGLAWVGPPRPGTATRPRRASSASSTSSPGRTSSSRSGTPSRRTWPRSGAAWRGP